MFARNKFTSLIFEIMETAVELIRAYIPYPHFENQKEKNRGKVYFGTSDVRIQCRKIIKKKCRNPMLQGACCKKWKKQTCVLPKNFCRKLKADLNPANEEAINPAISCKSDKICTVWTPKNLICKKRHNIIHICPFESRIPTPLNCIKKGEQSLFDIDSIC